MMCLPYHFHSLKVLQKKYKYFKKQKAIGIKSRPHPQNAFSKKNKPKDFAGPTIFPYLYKK